MKALRLLLLLASFGLWVGCKPAPPPTISGVFGTSSDGKLSSNSTSYDFRTDGTVIYKSTIRIGNNAILDNGKGNYQILTNHVIANIHYEQQITGSEPVQKQSIWIFRIDGNDLIAISKDGEPDSKQERIPRKG